MFSIFCVARPSTWLNARSSMLKLRAARSASTEGWSVPSRGYWLSEWSGEGTWFGVGERGGAWVDVVAAGVWIGSPGSAHATVESWEPDRSSTSRLGAKSDRSQAKIARNRDGLTSKTYPQRRPPIPFPSTQLQPLARMLRHWSWFVVDGRWCGGRAEGKQGAIILAMWRC